MGEKWRFKWGKELIWGDNERRGKIEFSARKEVAKILCGKKNHESLF
jgi:hypothetical protein